MNTVRRSYALVEKIWVLFRTRIRMTSVRETFCHPESVGNDGRNRLQLE